MTSDTRAFSNCIDEGGVAVFPADTVYGLACDPQSSAAVERLYSLKGRDSGRPAAVMFFDVDLALAALAELGPRTREAVARLLPGAVTVLLPNPEHRFRLACGLDPETLGLRVPVADALAGVGRPVLQSSANPSGGADPRRLQDIDATLLEGADLVIDGGELPGTPSTVVDLRGYEERGEWSVLREGAVSRAALARVLGL